MKMPFLFCALFLMHGTLSALTASPEVSNVLHAVAANTPAGSNISALLTVIEQLDSGTSIDGQILHQALQQALQVLSSHPGFNPLTVLEYTGILLEALAQIALAEDASTTTTIATAM